MAWRQVDGFEGLYEVSDTGEVRNARTGLVLKSRPDADGYRLVTLWRGKPAEKHDCKVHRLVLVAFKGPAPVDAPEGDHRNGRRDDNALGNLRWASISVNRRNLHCAVKGASGTRGVRFRADRPRPWQAYARTNGRFRSLGCFSSKPEAAAARAAFEQEALA